MVTLKASGIMLTGIGAFILLNKAMNIVDHSVSKICESNRWKNYYKSFWKGGVQAEQPVAPGYSRTSYPTAETAVVDDPKGNDHAEDGKKKANSNSIGEAIKAFCDAVLDGMKAKTDKDAEAPENGSEGQTEASEEDIPEKDAEPAINDVDFLHQTVKKERENESDEAGN